MSAEAPVKVMVVDEQPARAEALSRALHELGYEVVGRLAPEDDLPARVEAWRPDVVVIDVEAPSRDTLEQVGALNREQPRPVLMFSPAEEAAVVREALRAGVTVYVAEGIDRAKVRPLIESATEQFRQHEALRAELDRTRESLEERKRVERAKGLLMSHRGLSEPAAYRLLQKRAMDRHRKMAEVADEIIDAAELLDGPAEASS